MLSEDQYMERTPDLVAKIRKLREAAEKEMNRFTCLSDYDVRRVVGQRPRTAPVSAETVSASAAENRPKRSSGRPSTTQTSIEFSPAPAESGDDGEVA
jgi:hypothetical protein